MNEPSTNAPGTTELSLLEVWAVVLRFRRVIFAIAVAVMVIAVLMTFVLPRTWTTRTTFTPQSSMDAGPSQLSALAGQFGISVGGGFSGETPEFYEKLILSETVVDATVRTTYEVHDTTGLFPRGVLDVDIPTLLEVDARAEPVRTELGARWLKQEALNVSSDAETGTVTIQVTTEWPELSAGIANRVAGLVADFNLDSRQSQAAAERRFIEEQLESARAELHAAEDSLQHFLQNNRGFQNSPELMFRHDRLQRQVAMRQQIYTSLLQSYEEARIAEVRNTPVITVIDPAKRPARPDDRHLLLRIILGLIAGAGIGLIVAAVLESLRRKRSQAATDLAEVSELWRDTKRDAARLIRPLRSRRPG